MRRIDRPVERGEQGLVERRGLGRVRYEVHERCFRLTSEPDREALVLGHRHAATGRTGVDPSSALVGAAVVLHADVLPRAADRSRTNVRVRCVRVEQRWAVEQPLTAAG